MWLLWPSMCNEWWPIFNAILYSLLLLCFICVCVWCVYQAELFRLRYPLIAGKYVGRQQVNIRNHENGKWNYDLSCAWHRLLILKNYDWSEVYGNWRNPNRRALNWNSTLSKYSGAVGTQGWLKIIKGYDAISFLVNNCC